MHFPLRSCHEVGNDYYCLYFTDKTTNPGRSHKRDVAEASIKPRSTRLQVPVVSFPLLRPTLKKPQEFKFCEEKPPLKGLGSFFRLGPVSQRKGKPSQAATMDASM